MNKDNSIWTCMREELSLDASLDKARKIRDNRNRSRCYSRKKMYEDQNRKKRKKTMKIAGYIGEYSKSGFLDKPGEIR